MAPIILGRGGRMPGPLRRRPTDDTRRPDCLAGHVGLELRNVVAKYPFERLHRFPVIRPNSGRRDYSRSSCDGGRRSSGPVALARIAAIFCRSLSACRRPLHCRLVESEKPTASPQRSPETQIDHRPDGLRRRPPCCFSVASWSLRTSRHGVISDFEWTFVHFCSCLPSMQIMTRPLARFAPSA